ARIRSGQWSRRRRKWRPALVPAKAGTQLVRAGCPLSRAWAEKNLPMHQGPGARVGEELDQHGMLLLAVEDDHGLDTGFERVHAGFDLGDHATRDRPVGDEAPRVVDREFLDQLLSLVEYAWHVGQQQQALRLQRARDRPREGVGIDVEA